MPPPHLPPGLARLYRTSTSTRPTTTLLFPNAFCHTTRRSTCVPRRSATLVDPGTRALHSRTTLALGVPCDREREETSAHCMTDVGGDGCQSGCGSRAGAVCWGRVCARVGGCEWGCILMNRVYFHATPFADGFQLSTGFLRGLPLSTHARIRALTAPHFLCRPPAPPCSVLEERTRRTAPIPSSLPRSHTF